MILEFSNKIWPFLLLSVLFFPPFALDAQTQKKSNNVAKNPPP